MSHDEGQTLWFTWGEGKTTPQIGDVLDSIARGYFAPMRTYVIDSRDQAFDRFITGPWGEAPATCDPKAKGDKLANPYLYDPAVDLIRTVMRSNW